MAYNHPMERYKEGRAKYFAAVADDARGGGDSLLFGRSRLDFREDFHQERGAVLEQVTQRGYQISMPGGF